MGLRDKLAKPFHKDDDHDHLGHHHHHHKDLESSDKGAGILPGKGPVTAAEANVSIDDLPPSSQGHRTFVPPNVSTEPIHANIGDYANAKDPTDNTVSFANREIDNDNPWLPELEQAEGAGHFYLPKDTQGDPRGTNPEATHVEAKDIRGLKTAPQHVLDKEKRLNKEQYHFAKDGELPHSAFKADGDSEYHQNLASSDHSESTADNQNNRSIGNKGGISAVMDRFHKEQHKLAVHQTGATGPEEV